MFYTEAVLKLAAEKEVELDKSLQLETIRSGDYLRLTHCLTNSNLRLLPPPPPPPKLIPSPLSRLGCRWFSLYYCTESQVCKRAGGGGIPVGPVSFGGKVI